MTAPFLALVADDLTGAADAVAPFASAWHVELRLAAGAAATRRDEPTVYAETTDSRARSLEDAAALTHAAVTDLRVQGADRLFIKVDSTMRGSVPGQIRGALDAWGAGAFAVLCPAYPQHGRTVSNNIVAVNGVPVAETGTATDPVTPVTTSKLAELVPGSVHLPAPTSAATLAAALLAAAADGATIIAVDASTQQHLTAIAAAVQLIGDRAVAIGSSGLATALSRTWLEEIPVPAVQPDPNSGEVLVVVSSLHTVSRAQLATLLASGFPAAHMVSTPTNKTESPEVVARSLAGAVQQRLASGQFTAVVLVGGDGALAVLRQLGATAIHIHRELFDGVPLGAVIGGTADGLTVVTKSGGFGGPDALAEIVSSLQPQNHTQKRTTA